MTADIHDLTARRSVGRAGALLHSLVPRAQCFCYYDLGRDCRWSSDGADDREIDDFVANLPEEIVEQMNWSGDALHRSLPSGRTVLAMPVDDESQKRLGLLVALFSRNAGRSASFNPKMLRDILAPAVMLVGASLNADSRLAAAQQHAQRLESELELVYEIDDRIHRGRARHSGLAELVGRSGRYLGINYSVLLIPSKRIRVSATHSSWKAVHRKAVDRYVIEQLMPRLGTTGQPKVFEIPAVAGSNNVADQGYHALVSPLFDLNGNIEGVLALMGRVDGARFTAREKRFASNVVRKVEGVIERSFDAVTGLMNRAGFEAQLQESLRDLSSKTDAHQLVYFDLDNLQVVNDNFGREAGDEVIKRFARLLDEDLPKSGVLSRLAGDDFCLLLTHAETDEALEYAKDVRSKSGALRYLEGDRSLQISMSIGIATFNRASGSDGSALTTARMACEAARDYGGDRIEVYDDCNQSVVRRYDDMQLVAQIQQAIDNNSFELQAQPIVSLRSDHDAPEYEVLLRMAGSDGELLPTAALFSAAERYQMMPQIDRWVVSRTIAKLGEVREFVDGLGASFAINLSGQTIGDAEILDFIRQEIDASGIPPSALRFEITESAAVANLGRAQAFINGLRDLGCRIALDDFGAGLSSFAYLKNFAVDTLKIDGSFVRDIVENRISESMVAAITQVAKVMGLKTVAEFIECAKTREIVAGLGVDCGQGHFIGRPVPLDTVLADMSDLTSESAY